MIPCPHCGALNQAIAKLCLVCHRPLGSAEIEESIAPASKQTHRARTFDLKSIMILIAVLGAGFGLFRFAPGLGILYLVFVTPALVRTYGYSAQRKAAGKPLDFLDSVSHFLTSMSIVFLTLLAGSMAFIPTCMCLGFGLAQSHGMGLPVPGPLAITLPITFGLLVAGNVAYKVIRRLWPTKD